MSHLFVVAPRYAHDLRILFEQIGMVPKIVTRTDTAAAAFAASGARVAVIDLRGARSLVAVAAREIGDQIAARRGALLALVGRGENGASAGALAVGATHILVSPFGHAEFRDALSLAQCVADRLGDAFAGHPSVRPVNTRRDPLTGLATAEHAEGWTARILATSDPAVTVMLIAVGRFGELNSAHGTGIADRLLQAVARRLTSALGEDAGVDNMGTSGGGAAASPGARRRLLARGPGAEFVVVMPGTETATDAELVARRIVAACDTPFATDGRVFYLGVRIGIASVDPDTPGTGAGTDTAGAANTLFRRAESALARARTGAPGTIEIATGALDLGPLIRRADLEIDLRRALDAGELEIGYQPQVNLASGRIAGVEALLRWTHPVLGPVPVQTLLEVAADAEIATRLGSYIRTRALTDAAAWPAALGGLKVSVNVTAGDLRAPLFVAGLDAALSESGFPRDRLTLEITENDLIENLDTAAATLATVRATGVRIALDDFGTGYSSLAYLKSLPLDILKLDKKLTRDLASTPRDRIIVRGVVRMARALGMRVTAEGVETPADLALVVAAHCDCYQGFLCAPALTSAELASFTQAWNARVSG